jgi:NADP-dependent 3-hydroxy acid dehydrogenase YdfG
MKGIEGKVVVITGTSSGIGEATALLLASKENDASSYS